ncbi:MAG TPA: protein kinase [Kofleriaceae bacterium]|nr:protein kinase [Kofleriaceae bacterium]
MAELPGSFGKYFLCDKIAAGGMAEIYLAKLIGPGGFEKQLVIKQINPELSKERQFVELFVAEAKTLVALSHGNIVPVYELGVVDDTYFIAMEYVDGPTLADLVAELERRGERLEPAVAAHVASELCKGLDYAHRKGEGVVHRDLSPRNVLLSRDGEVKLVDFGLALATDRARRGQPGAALPAGSFPYMSPEQVRREPLDARSDLFSLGVLLWEMLTGTRLFARDDPETTLAAVLGDPIPPPSQVAPVPEELDRICLRALARAHGDRYASAGEILAALARFGYSVEPPVTQATLAALVARVSPARRAGTEPGSAESQPDRPEIEPSERTRPHERRAGRKRPATMRTFATSERFDEVLANATPLMPFPALSDSAARVVRELAPRRDLPSARATHPPARRRLWPAATAAAAVAAAVLALLALRRDPAGRPAPIPTAAIAVSDSTVANPSAVANPIAVTNPTPTATTVASTDPRPPDPTPVSEPPAPRSSAPATKDRRPKGQGTLQVGANPWADVYLDGAPLGQAPGAWPVPAGPHTIELRHRDQRRSFRISVDAGETEALGLVDFTAP